MARAARKSPTPPKQTTLAIAAYSSLLRVVADGKPMANVPLLGTGAEPVPEIFEDRFEQ